MAKLLQCSQLNIVAPKTTELNLKAMAEKSGMLYNIATVRGGGTSFTFWGHPAEISGLMSLLNGHSAVLPA